MSTRRAPTLSVLVAFFAISVGLRVLTTAERAAAFEQTGLPEIAAAETCIAPETPEALVEALSRREAAVSERESLVEKQVTQLEESRVLLEAKLAELRAAEQALSETLALSDAAAETDLTTLTAVYEQMKPADAAALFSTMAPDFAAGFLARLSPNTAAGILTGLDPEQAYTISVILAGRNANAPTE